MQCLHENGAHNVIHQTKATHRIVLSVIGLCVHVADLCYFLFSFCRVLEQHKLSREQWEERIQVWHEEHRGMLK